MGITIDKLHHHQIYNTDDARFLAAQMNKEEDDDWTYTVIVNPQNEARAIIEVRDEDGDFVAYL